ncbi:hypothetical_protein_-_unknown_function [Leishmania major strain Friedlin]|nr:hypothetical_protein_-_unknown_function [Leishmania major strain Friedlin]
MQCYEWAPDYFRALAAIPSATATSATATSAPGDWHGESSGRVSDALGLVQRAAHAMLRFTRLFCALEGACAIHHERHCGVAGEQQPVPFHARQRYTTSALGGYKQTRAVISVADEASAPLLHALAATPTRERLRSAAAASDAVRAVSHSITTGQLLAETRDLVVFAWRAIEVRRRRAVGAAGTSEDHAAAPYRSAAHGAARSDPESKAYVAGSGLRRQLASAAAVVDEEQDVLLRLVRTATRFSVFNALLRVDGAGFYP